MNLTPISRQPLNTARLVLRPTDSGDAVRAFQIQSDWEVTRMLRLAAFPPDHEEIGAWFADHRRQWLAGEAYRFAVEKDGRMIGLVDIDGIAERAGTLGYWLDRSAWGFGYAYEAALKVVRFAFGEVGLTGLQAAHAADNLASARILKKLGFSPTGEANRYSRPRGEDVVQRRYALLSSGS